jgi:hypothetical protein
MKTSLLVSGLVACLTGLGISVIHAQDIAPLGTGIIGVKTVVDGNPGTPRANAGFPANINDSDLTSRVDDWWAGGESNGPVSYVGVIWPTTRYDTITNLTVTFALFFDGGWFGVSGLIPPGQTEVLSATANLLEPTLQVTTNGGVSWVTVPHTSDYLTSLDGLVVPGTATANFTIDPPVTQVNGLRLIGPNGGNGADTNGFIGIYEMEIDALPPVDTDADGLPDTWMMQYFGHATAQASDSSTAGDDPDGDGLTNLQEYNAGTNPKNPDTDADGLSDGQEVNTTLTNPLAADTDGDGLSDGAEVNTYHTNPLVVDTDGDGLSDGDEVLKYHTNPLVADTDGDGFPDGMEIAYGTGPLDPNVYPSDRAVIGVAIMGTSTAIDSGIETPLFHAGTSTNINDGDLTTRADTFNGGITDPASFVGVLWPQVITNTIVKLDLTLATFVDGGWFGVNNAGPGAGGLLNSNYLVTPSVQVTADGGTTWTNVPFSSDYFTVLNGHGVGGGANPNPTSATTSFTITNSVLGTYGISGINGIRLIGAEGGTASGGFIGVFEFAALTASGDSDHNGLPDDWERLYFGHIGVDPTADPDTDGLSNLEEYKAGTNPLRADTDGDGLNDGDEVKAYHTDPLQVDTDGDGLSDGVEVHQYHTNPLAKDTDGDGYADGVEVARGTDPNDAASFPDDLALLGTGILGTKDAVDSGTETPVLNAGTASAINDGDLTTHVDTWNNGGTSTASYVGILWSQPLTNPITSLELNLATFFDGGWFGVNGVSPGAGSVLTAADDLVEPVVQVTSDGGANWTTVADTSDYTNALDGHPLPAVAFGPPTLAKATFTLTTPHTGINGIRIIGTEGGIASGGFLGVFELLVHSSAAATAHPVRLSPAIPTGAQFVFTFYSQLGVTHTVEFKNALTDSAWQTLKTVTGDGTLQTVIDNASGASRVYRVTSKN